MSAPELDWRSALTGSTLGSLVAGASLPLAALALSPDQLLATRSPVATALWSAAVGTALVLPLLLAATLATLRWPRIARALPIAVALATPALTGWLFGLRAGHADALTALGALVLCAALAAGAAALSPALARLDPLLKRSWPVAAIPPLLLLSGLLPLGPPAPVEPIAPSLEPWEPPPLDEPVPERPRTVVLLTVDTLRADHLDAWRYGRSTLPSLDRLAESGLVFEQLTAASSGTVPSFGTLLTGLSPECTGVIHQLSTLGPGATTAAERFRDAGYRTLAVVTNHNLDAKHGFDQGFDEFQNLGEADARTVLDTLRPRLAELPADQPLFLWVHLFDPHTPYVSDGEALRGDPVWTDERLPLIDFGSWGGAHRTRTTGEPLRGATASKGELVARYDAEIRAIDLPVQWLIEWAWKRGGPGHSALLFTADHGETLVRGRRDVAFQHALQVYEDDLHVPAILWAPGRVPRGRISLPTRHVDLLPSLLDAARLPADPSLPGASVLQQGPRPTAAAARSAWWDAVSLRLVPIEARAPSRSIRHEGWKLIVHPHRSLVDLDGPASWVDAWRGLWSGIAQDDQLYYLTDDPGELRDRIREEPERAARLRGILAHELTLPEACQEVRAEALDLDAETREQLRAMGYLD